MASKKGKSAKHIDLMDLVLDDEEGGSRDTVPHPSPPNEGDVMMTDAPTLASSPEGQSSSDTVLCLDTQADLEVKIKNNKGERKRKREDRHRKLEAEARDTELKKQVLSRIMERSHAMNTAATDTPNGNNNPSTHPPPLVTPGNGASKMAYGRQKTHTHNLTERERILAKPERLVHVYDMPESEAIHLQRGYKEALGLKNFADYFMTTEAFVEKRPEQLNSATKALRSATNNKSLQRDGDGEDEDGMIIEGFERQALQGPNSKATQLMQAVKQAHPDSMAVHWSENVAEAMMPLFASATHSEASPLEKKANAKEGGEDAPVKRAKRGRPVSPPKLKKESKKSSAENLMELELIDTDDQEADAELLEPPAKRPKLNHIAATQTSEHADGQEEEEEGGEENNANDDEELSLSGIGGPMFAKSATTTTTTAVDTLAVPNTKGKRKVGRKAREKAKASEPVEKLLRSQVALADLSGMRELDADAANFLSQVGENKAVKAKPPRYEYLIRTEAPPAGQSNVRAARREYLNENAFHEEATRALNQKTASIPSNDMGALRYHDRDESIPSAVLAGLERRHVAVIDEAFFEPNEAQQHLLRQGDKLALSMAKEQAHPSLLPRLPIDDPELRAREQGRDPRPMALSNAILELHQHAPSSASGSGNERGSAGLDTAALPLIAVKETDARQPMYKYLKMFGKASRVAAEGMIDEIVFDQKRILFNTISSVQLYLSQPDHPELAALDENDCKILHKNACQRARNIKKQREPIERQAESEPPRLRTRIADARVEFCLERWNRQDAMFLHDWPQLADPKYESQLPDRIAKAISAQHSKRLDASKFGPLGQILSRNREKIRDRDDRTGTRYFVSSEELGSSRLHPSANKSIPRVHMSHRLAHMEQPRLGEDECANGYSCYCYKGNISFVDQTTYFSMTNTMGFICKAYRTPDEYARFLLTGERPKERRLCIVCRDSAITELVYSTVGSDIRVTEPIHDHCVYTDIKGEYRKTQCLPGSYRINGVQVLTGIVAPYPEFNEGDYLHDVRSENGVNIRFLRYCPARAGF